MLPLQKSTYLARACGAPTISEPSSNGNRSIAVPCEITQGEFAGNGITWIAVFHDTADRNGVTGTERIIQSLQYMGWQGDDISELLELSDEEIKRLLPEEVSLACDVETYDGKTRLKVQWVNKPGAGRFAFTEGLSKNDARSFAAQLKSTVKAVRASNGGPKPAAPAPQKPAAKGWAGNSAGGGSKDDIPFLSCELSDEPSAIARVVR